MKLKVEEEVDEVPQQSPTPSVSSVDLEIESSTINLAQQCLFELWLYNTLMLH